MNRRVFAEGLSWHFAGQFFVSVFLMAAPRKSNVNKFWKCHFFIYRFIWENVTFVKRHLPFYEADCCFSKYISYKNFSILLCWHFYSGVLDTVGWYRYPFPLPAAQRWIPLPAPRRTSGWTALCILSPESGWPPLRCLSCAWRIWNFRQTIHRGRHRSGWAARVGLALPAVCPVTDFFLFGAFCRYFYESGIQRQKQGLLSFNVWSGV